MRLHQVLYLHKKERVNMTEKFYAVKEGREPGIYTTWEECQNQVKGYSNAKYKSFAAKKEAEDYVNGKIHVKPVIKPATSPVDIKAYVDGSWNVAKAQYGWGFILVDKGKIISRGSGCGNNRKYLSQKQIGGEVVAVLKSIERAIFKGYKHVEIVFDYSGIELFATGNWQANSNIAKAYIYHLAVLNQKIDITFVKVKSHSGDYFNDTVDKLAKKGAKKTK